MPVSVFLLFPKIIDDIVVVSSIIEFLSLILKFICGTYYVRKQVILLLLVSPGNLFSLQSRERSSSFKRLNTSVLYQSVRFVNFHLSLKLKC